MSGLGCQTQGSLFSDHDPDSSPIQRWCLNRTGPQKRRWIRRGQNSRNRKTSKAKKKNHQEKTISGQLFFSCATSAIQKFGKTLGGLHFLKTEVSCQSKEQTNSVTLRERKRRKLACISIEFHYCRMTE